LDRYKSFIQSSQDIFLNFDRLDLDLEVRG